MCMCICLSAIRIGTRRPEEETGFRGVGITEGLEHKQIITIIKKNTERYTKIQRQMKSKQFHRKVCWSLVNYPMHKQYKKLESCTDLKYVQKKKKKTRHVYSESFLLPTCLNVTKAFYVWHMNCLLLNCRDNSNKVYLNQKQSLLIFETALFTFEINCKAMTHLLLCTNQKNTLTSVKSRSKKK